jgi:hypothetical protein
VEGVNVCAPATWNDIVPLAGTQQTRARLGCPRQWAVTWLRPQVNPTQDDYCQTNADCNIGTDAGVCEPDNELRLRDGGLGKSCKCTVGTGGAQCPNSPDGGTFSQCKSGVSGARTYCIASVVCMPPAGKAYAPVEEYGCGLAP